MKWYAVYATRFPLFHQHNDIFVFARVFPLVALSDVTIPIKHTTPETRYGGCELRPSVLRSSHYDELLRLILFTSTMISLGRSDVIATYTVVT